MSEADLSVQRRKEIFLALVEAQDEGVSVVQSRKEVAQSFGVTDRQLREIEQEGRRVSSPVSRRPGETA